MGHNVLLVAKEDGHSPRTVLMTYAAWTEGATETDVEAIRRAMERSHERACTVSIAAPDRPLRSAGFATRTWREEKPRQWGRLELPKDQAFRCCQEWRSGRDSNPAEALEESVSY